MLFVGLVSGDYPLEWVNRHFYFDVRGFYFPTPHKIFYRSSVLAHLGGQPYLDSNKNKANSKRKQEIGYRDFKRANLEVDHAFIESVKKLITAKGTPIMLAIAGPTAAGKTEIVERLRTII